MTKFYEDLLLAIAGVVGGIITASFSYFSNNRTNRTDKEGFAMSHVEGYWKRIDAQSAKLDQQDEHIRQQSEQIKKQSDEIHNLSHLFKEAQEENKRLSQHVKQLTAENARLTTEVKRLNRKIAAFAKKEKEGKQNAKSRK